MNKQKRRKIRFPGIVGATRALGVSRSHLWFVLTGERLSPRLLCRYRKYQRDIRRTV